MRQGANSAVRFTTYTTLKQFVLSTSRPGQQLPAGITFAIGAVAGLVTVCVTQPFEYVLFFVLGCLFDVWYSVIKTRMQSLNARQEYKNSFHCGYRILTEEGLFRFWTGTAPRLVRLVVSNRLGSPCMQRITIPDEWRDHLYCIRKRHQSYWRTGVEVVSLDGYIVCTSNPAISAHAFPFRRLYWKSCSLDHID